MIEVYPFLYIGDQNDYESNVKHQPGWYVVHACKEPYHRQALGYTGRAVSNTHPEYLIARRGNRLILNMVDADDPSYIGYQHLNRENPRQFTYGRQRKNELVGEYLSEYAFAYSVAWFHHFARS